MHWMNWDFDGRLHSIFEFYNLIKRTYGSMVNIATKLAKPYKTIQKPCLQVDHDLPLRKRLAAGDACHWKVPANTKGLDATWPMKNWMMTLSLPIQSHEWQRPKVSMHFEGTIKMHSQKSRLATWNSGHLRTLTVSTRHHLASHPIMPLANKSPWSSVGCVCNNRRLGSLFECSKNHSQKQMQTEKIPGFRTDSPPGYLHWLYLPDLEAPAVMKNTQGWALLVCWCFVTFVSPESSLNHLGCLWWQITKVRMGLAREQIQQHGIVGLRSSSCRAVGVGVGHFRSEMEKGDKTYKPHRLLISDVSLQVKKKTLDNLMNKQFHKIW